MINYHDKKFRPVVNSKNSEITPKTIFLYQQQGNIVTCNYKGENILEGHLIGIVADDGSIDMRYHQISSNGALMTGICKSKPEIDCHGKIKLYETWQWTSGDNSKGNSILEEI